MANARRGSLSRRQFVRSAAASAVIGGYLRSARADAAAPGGESRPILMKSDLVLAPPDYPLTDEEIRKHIPVPGKD